MMIQTDEKKLLKQIDSIYQPTIKNIDAQNPRLLVLFSAPPGSGKSTIAKEVEDHLHAIRLENDAVRRIVHTLDPKMDAMQRSALTYKYMSRLIPELLIKSPNGLIVIDSSIDRRYDEFRRLAQGQGLDSFVIALQLPEADHKERILGRDPHSFSSLEDIFSLMSQRRTEQEQFLAKHQPDIVVDQNTSLADVVDAVNKRLGK